LNFTIFCV